MPSDRTAANRGFTTIRVQPDLTTHTTQLPAHNRRNMQTTNSVYYLSPSSMLLGGTNLPAATMSNFWTRELHSDNEKLPTIDEKPSFSIRGHRAKSLPMVNTQHNAGTSTITTKHNKSRHSWTEGVPSFHVRPAENDKIHVLTGKKTEIRPATSWDKNGRRRVHFTAVQHGEEVVKGIQRYNAAQKLPSGAAEEKGEEEGNEEGRTPIIKVTVTPRNSKSAGDAVKADVEAARISAATEAWCKRYLGQQRLRKPPPPTTNNANNEVNKFAKNVTTTREQSKQSAPTTEQRNSSNNETSTTIHVRESTETYLIPKPHINFCDHRKTERIMKWLDEVNLQTKIHEKISGKWNSDEEGR